MSDEGTMTTESADGDSKPDPDLLALPEPRRPFRGLTLASLVATFGLSLGLLVQLLPMFQYALQTGAPQDLGELEAVRPQDKLHNTWVRGSGQLDDNGLAYRRPMDGDRYRAAPIAENPKLWVEVRIPGELDSTRFIPPASFVGRFVRLEQAGPGYSALADAVQKEHPNAWLLVDGDSPASTRWVIGLGLMLIGFASFAVVACIRIVKPSSFEKRRALSNAT